MDTANLGMYHVHLACILVGIGEHNVGEIYHVIQISSGVSEADFL